MILNYNLDSCSSKHKFAADEAGILFQKVDPKQGVTFADYQSGIDKLQKLCRWVAL